jgi:predicted alpha/beta hydrolase family esterase
VSTHPALLFVDGGGDEAYRYDKKIADRLQKALGSEMPFAFPFIHGLEALDWPAVAAELGDALRELPRGAIVVAHSVGASAVLKLLSEGIDPKLAHLFLLAVPYNGADGEWGGDDFAFPADFARRLPKGLPITIWHSEDDEIIPADSARRYAEELPSADVHFLVGYGHQFTKSVSFLADAIRGASK